VEANILRLTTKVPIPAGEGGLRPNCRVGGNGSPVTGAGKIRAKTPGGGTTRHFLTLTKAQGLKTPSEVKEGRLRFLEFLGNKTVRSRCAFQSPTCIRHREKKGGGEPGILVRKSNEKPTLEARNGSARQKEKLQSTIGDRRTPT